LRSLSREISWVLASTGTKIGFRLLMLIFFLLRRLSKRCEHLLRSRNKRSGEFTSLRKGKRIRLRWVYHWRFMIQLISVQTQEICWWLQKLISNGGMRTCILFGTCRIWIVFKALQKCLGFSNSRFFIKLFSFFLLLFYLDYHFVMLLLLFQAILRRVGSPRLEKF